MNRSPTRDHLRDAQMYAGYACERCGRTYPDTVPNVEGHLHHAEPWRCLDTKKCNQVVRRQKRKGPR